MARSEEAEAWFAAVCEAVRQIPRGKVTSYGHIARLLGHPERPRQVGTVMRALPAAASELEFHSGNVPWQRVINSKGAISPREPGSAARQARALEAEDVEVGQNSMGEFTISFDDYGWFPAELADD